MKGSVLVPFIVVAFVITLLLAGISKLMSGNLNFQKHSEVVEDLRTFDLIVKAGLKNFCTETIEIISDKQVLLNNIIKVGDQIGSVLVKNIVLSNISDFNLEYKKGNIVFDLSCNPDYLACHEKKVYSIIFHPKSDGTLNSCTLYMTIDLCRSLGAKWSSTEQRCDLCAGLGGDSISNAKCFF